MFLVKELLVYRVRSATTSVAERSTTHSEDMVNKSIITSHISQHTRYTFGNHDQRGEAKAEGGVNLHGLG